MAGKERKLNVALEQKICMVTGQKYDTNALIMDTRLVHNPKFDNMHVTTGYGVSPEVEEKFNDGYIAMIEVDAEKSEFLPNGNIKPEGAYRTGNVVFLKREAAKHIFNVDLDGKHMVFVDADVINYLNKLKENEQNDTES